LALYLFLHDDWASFEIRTRGRVGNLARGVARRRNGRIFRRARGLFSVSEGMSKEILRTCGVKSAIVYPTRGDDTPAPRIRVSERPSARAPVLAHVGLIHADGTAALLRKVAALLGERGGTLDMYTRHSAEELTAWSLTPPLVRNQGFLSAAEMWQRIETTADGLFLTASFEEKDRRAVTTLFPSKLADYTAAGLPILIWGPEYSSAVCWARANPNAALVHTNLDPGPVRDALLRIISDRAFAAGVAANAIEAGKLYFDLDVARRAVFDQIERTPL
jgi:hypothetical protein